MATHSRSQIVSRITIGLFTGVIVLGGATVGASAAGLLPSAPATSLDPSPYEAPPPEAVEPSPGLETASADGVPDAASLQQRVDAVSQAGVGTISYSVTDLAGDQLLARDADAGRIPASSWKILTALAALSAYGPDHRFDTKVVTSTTATDPTTPVDLILVGGGDPLLTATDPRVPGQASLPDLADQVVQSLSQTGQTQVSLGFDDSLFAGPQWNPSWAPEYAGGDIAPISALSCDPYGGPSDNTSLNTARTFQKLLADRGLTVTMANLAGHLTSDFQVLGRVESPPLSQLVSFILSSSYNFGAEVLLRQVSVAAGGDGSIAASREALTAFLQGQGLWTDQMSVDDGSGLSRSDRVSASVLTTAIRAAWKDPQWRSVLAALPVAGATGTLTGRFDDPAEAGGRGVVHAKTGTLYDVNTLTGFTQTTSGAVLVFSFMVNDVTDPTASVGWLDQVAASLATAA